MVFMSKIYKNSLYTSLLTYVFYFSCIVRNGIGWLNNLYSFNVIRNCQTVLQSGHAILCFYKQCIKVLFVPHLWRHFVLSAFHSIECIVFHLTLMCIPVMTDEVEHLSMQSLIICMLLWCIFRHLIPIFKAIVCIIDAKCYIYIYSKFKTNTYFINTFTLSMPCLFSNQQFFKKFNALCIVKYTLFGDSSLVFDKSHQLCNCT